MLSNFVLNPDSNLFNSPSGRPHLKAPGMRMINVKLTPTPGFSKGSGSVCGKKPLVFFVFKGSVSKISPFIDFDLLPLIVGEANTQGLGRYGVFEDSNRVKIQKV